MTKIALPTRRLNPQLAELLMALKVGDKINITQTIRVGAKSWPASTTGVFRGVNYLATGVTTDRVPEDDIIVPTVHFTKDNGELSSIALDEKTTIQRA
jgi:hypothetical protein